MTDQKPDPGHDPESTDSTTTPPEPSAPGETASSPGSPVDEPAAAGEAELGGAGEAEDAATDGMPEPEADAPETAGDTEAAVAETEAEAADSAAAAGAAWTTTPVAPDPEATEAALAALAAKPEVTLEPPETPPMGPGDEPPEEGTPVLLVGGILVGAFIVALAVVLILFRPFDNPSELDGSLSPSPLATSVPSASLSVVAVVDTPNFRGLTLEEAEAKATDYGLVVRVTPVETDESDAGTVLDQDPAPGESVDEGSTIDLAVAQAVPTNAVPDVVGMRRARATTTLQDAGFVVGEVTQRSSATAAGMVIETDPETDTELPTGSSVDLVISSGPEQVAVPDLTDQPEAAALTALDDAGLVAGERSEAYDDTIAAGNVLGTAPAAGSEVDPGSAVAYVVSLGREQVAVPDLTDQPEAAALTALDDAGLVAGERSEAYDDTIAAGNVLGTAPAAGSEVDPGSAVAYVVSLGREQVAVPDLTDQPEAAALTALDDAGLVAGERSEAYDDTIAAGNVLGTAPAAGSEVDPGSAVAYVVSLGREQVAVPDLTDQPEAAALTALDDAGLVAGERSEAYDDTIAAGNVLGTAPAAGSEVDPGSAVAYVVSLGREQVAVPDLTDQPEAAALTALDDAGLVAGERSEAYDDTIAAGNVLGTAPAAGSEVDPGSAVAYVVSLGREQVAVPDLTDQPEAAALTALDDAGLVAGERSEAYDDTIAAGNVLGTAPAAGSEVDPGSAVAYVVSLGREQVAVPDLTDQPEAAALTALDDAGLVAGERSEAYDDTIAAGNVLGTAPAAGSEVDPGSAVAYVVSLGREQVAVPDLTDQPEAAALTALDDAGLVAGERSEAYDDTIAAGNVLGTAPAAGSEVDPGSAVAYVVSLGREQVAVPDLTDQPEAAALTALDDAGLVAGERSEAYDDTIAAGNVLGTAPAAGSEVDPGSAVAYVVSLGREQVAVPDLTDQPEAAALTALDDAGLVAGERSEAYDDTIAAGNVLGTAPAAGSEVDPGSAVAYVVSLGREQVAVPDLTDQPEAAALTALDDAGLVAGERSEAYDDTIAAGNVLGTAPAAGSEVDPGSAVAYVVSLGREQVAVPDLTDQPEAAALTALDDAGLVAGERSEAYDDTIAAGNVLGTAPAAGSEVDPGSAVAYVVSLGREQVAVPDLTDQPEAAALTALDDAGLVAGERSEAYDDTIAAGNVLGTAPAAGSEVDPGSAVAYVVSLGREQVAVPDLTDQPEAAALTALDDAGLVAGERSEAYDDTIAAGNVLGTAPAAGSEVDPGSAVAYVVSLGREQVAVPDLTDQPEAAALTALDDAGLVAGERSEAYDDTIAAGNVLGTAPAAGSEVDPGSAVAYVVSLGREQVAVPDLTDQPEAAALTALDDAGLVAGERSEAYDDTIAAGNVLGTAPAAGSEVDPGSAVAYVVSLGREQVAVPDLTDQPEAAALTALDDAGLVAGERSEAYDDTIAAGNVLGTAPAAGSEVDPGSAVAYVVSLGREQVAVPDLTDQPEAAALTALDDAGLVAGERSEAYDDTIAAGNVLGTAPAAGSEVDPGSAVAYVVSLGREQVAVPDLTDQPEAAALTALDDAGLVAGERSEAYDDTIAAGNVLGTAPAAGSEVDPGSAVAYVVSLGREQVAVPDLTDQPEAAALTALDDAGLVAGERSEAYDDTIAAGNVLGTAPAAGSEVDPGSAVAYVVSLGREQVAVPDLTDQPEAAALTALDDAGLVAGERSEAYDDTIAAGNVLGTAPAAGSEVDPGSAVAYVVSLGREQVAVPDLTDQPEAAALTALDDAGLVAGERSEAYDDTIAAGNVLGTAPAAGSEVDPGSAVAYVVSLGREQVAVPDVRGQSQGDAVATIESAGLSVGDTLERTNATVPAGQAVKTDPPAGETVDMGAVLTLTMSKGPKQVDVPAIVALPEAEATAALADAELQAGTVTQTYDDEVPAGAVVSQDPAAGTTVDVKSSVDYVVSLGIEQVEVPDLSGAAADAGQKLTAAGLTAGDVSEAYDERIAAGDVVSQDPAAGAQVDMGSSVEYVTSLGPTPLVTVPQVRDLPEGEAASTIEASDLIVAEAIQQSNEKVAEGNAIKTDPAADSEVAMGTGVTLYVSTGSSTRTIPEVRDMPAAEAQAALESEGLTVNVSERSNAKVAAGTAVKTEPAAGQQVDVGTEVTLIVSKGPKPVTVPDVVGAVRPDAKTTLTDAGLQVGEVSTVEDSSPANTVLTQDPAAATDVPQGSAVDLTVSAGPPSATIPEVRDMPAAEAQAALESEGLTVNVSERSNAKVAAGTAVKTEPAAGQQVDVGTEVTLIVSKGPKPVTVPDVVGAVRPDAKTTLTDAGLQVGEVSTVEDSSPANTVLTQDPAAATDVPQGSAVDLTVSAGPPSATIPEVRDMPAAEAQAALESEGLTVNVSERSNAKVAAGTAVKTEPAAGQQVDVGTEVTLIVSKGPKPVTVPDVVGAVRPDAKTTLTDAGLQVGEVSTVEDSSPANTVLTQDPAAATDVPQGSAVDLTVSAGPPSATIPEVRDMPAAEAQAALESEGLTVNVSERSNAKVAAGTAVKTEPAAGQQVDVGTEVTLIVSKGPKPVSVPNIVGLPEADALAALDQAGLVAGARSEANDEGVAAGSVVSQDPAADANVEKGSQVTYTVSLGASVQPFGAGGDLGNADVSSQLDAVATDVTNVRGLGIAPIPYDSADAQAQAAAVGQRAGIVWDTDSLKAEERALKRLGLLADGDDLGQLLDTLYRQPLPVAYLEDQGDLSVLSSLDTLDAGQQAEAARAFGRAATQQQFGSQAARVADRTAGDAAAAAYALEQGDGTAVMLDWASQFGNKKQADDVIVPGDEAVLASMPLLLQREYSFPFLEGRAFVDQLRKQDGWNTVNGAWGQVPASTEQIIHPKAYPNDRPTTISMDDIAARLGDGWKAQWQQTMGELRIGVWLANGQAGEQSGPRAPVKLPKAAAAAGWGGDRLVSLGGPGSQWAVVWQTKWDTPEDVDQFVKAAGQVLAGLPGANFVAAQDVSSGVSEPAVVLLTSDPDTLAQVAAALGVTLDG